MTQADRSAPVRIGVAGALGRMGRAIAAMAGAREGVVLGPLFDRPDLAGQTLDGVSLSGLEAAIAGSDVIVDFSTPEASASLAKACAAQGGPALVIGATGFSKGETRAVEAAAKLIPVVYSGNFSLGVNLLIGLVAHAAAALEAADFDIEVLEAHHRRKVDAPSGTALMLGRAAAAGRGVDLASVAERGRDGITGARASGAIGFASLRGGGIVGEHSVTFASDDEIITLSHSARDRSLFARGALKAALWVVGRAPGLYDMQDVLSPGRDDDHG
jgi:4-hydroxy-tetrahydrodipicolinate reductase